jgi:hypothetical protein
VLYDASRFPPENFDTGSPVEVVEVEGWRGDARRQVRVAAGTRHIRIRSGEIEASE